MLINVIGFRFSYLTNLASYMNNKIQELIDEKRERLESSKQAQRDKHLIKLGLIDEEKSNREYSDAYSHIHPYYDSEKKKHYREVKVALNITEQEYEELCKYFPPDSKNINTSDSYENTLNSHENTLNIMANITLGVGILCTIILSFSIMYTDVPYGKSELDLTGFAVTISVLLTTIISWALLRVISSISTNVRELNHKTKQGYCNPCNPSRGLADVNWE